jgi:hypothetical protein
MPVFTQIMMVVAMMMTVIAVVIIISTVISCKISLFCILFVIYPHKHMYQFTYTNSL